MMVGCSLRPAAVKTLTAHNQGPLGHHPKTADDPSLSPIIALAELNAKTVAPARKTLIGVPLFATAASCPSGAGIVVTRSMPVHWQLPRVKTHAVSLGNATTMAEAIGAPAKKNILLVPVATACSSMAFPAPYKTWLIPAKCAYPNKPLKISLGLLIKI